ncbi:hypothetical protein DN614_24600 [Klebsiella michiganensis]|nr:hypothetical protein DN614_24600 [Klebsiella michiganensis]
MEKHERNRLKPLALLICVLLFAPFVLAPLSLALKREPSTIALQQASQSTIQPRHTTTDTITTTTQVVTLEGMTLDAPIHRPASQVATKAVV